MKYTAPFLEPQTDDFYKDGALQTAHVGLPGVGELTASASDMSRRSGMGRFILLGELLPQAHIGLAHQALRRVPAPEELLRIFGAL